MSNAVDANDEDRNKVCQDNTDEPPTIITIPPTSRQWLAYNHCHQEIELPIAPARTWHGARSTQGNGADYLAHVLEDPVARDGQSDHVSQGVQPQESPIAEGVAVCWTLYPRFLVRVRVVLVTR